MTASRNQPSGAREPISRAAPSTEPSAASSVPGCVYCGETDISPSVECWEMYDEVICEDCADQAHEDNGQFGVGA
jgi:hypothetical protein